MPAAAARSEAWARAQFTAFCKETGRRALPAAPGTVIAWLEARQPSGRTAYRWAAAIRAAHLAAGYDDPCTGEVTAWIRRAARPGTSRALPPAETAALAARIPAYGWPAAIRGRRDRLAFTLNRLAAIPARALVTLRGTDLAVTGHSTVTLALGSPVTVTGPPGLPEACPACAAVRWGRVLRLAADLEWRKIRTNLDRTPPDPSAHVCGPMEAAGPQSWPLFPAVNQWGQFEIPPVPPVSERAMEGLLRDAGSGCGSYRTTAARRKPARDEPRPPVPAPLPAGPPPDPDWHRKGLEARQRDLHTLREADADFGGIYAAAEELEERARQILGKAMSVEDDEHAPPGTGD